MRPYQLYLRWDPFMNSTYDDLVAILKKMEGLDAIVFNGGMWHKTAHIRDKDVWHTFTISLQRFLARVLQARKDMKVSGLA